MLEQLTSGDFAAHVHETFRLYPGAVAEEPGQEPGGEPLPLELIKVAEFGPEATPKHRRGFSLLFLAPGPGHLEQRIYSLDHDSLGRLALFLVPVGPGQGGMLYEAIFT
ncbi:MAG TPA: hypothetical protein VGE07_04085 [Herpetosiphonaceae bacterium]